jgi:AraC-like DNA-binding protein
MASNLAHPPLAGNTRTRRLVAFFCHRPAFQLASDKMIATDLPRSTASARVLLDVALQRGLDADACLEGTGLDPLQLRDPTLEISGSQEERLMLNIVEHLGDDPALALDVGGRYSLPTFGMFGLILLSARTPREMVELSVRYQELSSTLARARVVRRRGQTFIDLDASHLSETVQNFLVDHCMAVIWSHMCALDGKPATASISLRRPRPPDISPYRRLFGFDPNFGAKRSRIGFEDAYLDSHRSQVDPKALEQCRHQCDILLERRRAEVGSAPLVAVVRARLERSTSAWRSMATIATELNFSLRTLARRLDDEGTSFRELNDAARRARAERLLQENLMPIESVATALGYATTSAFVRAFRRWHGEPPTSWRRSAAGRINVPR